MNPRGADHEIQGCDDGSARRVPVSKEQGPSIAASYSFYYYRRHPGHQEASGKKQDDDSLFFECQCLKKNPGFQILYPSL